MGLLLCLCRVDTKKGRASTGVSLSPVLRGEGRGEGHQRRTRWLGDSQSEGTEPFSPLAVSQRGARIETARLSAKRQAARPVVRPLARDFTSGAVLHLPLTQPSPLSMARLSSSKSGERGN